MKKKNKKALEAFEATLIPDYEPPEDPTPQRPAPAEQTANDAPPLVSEDRDPILLPRRPSFRFRVKTVYRSGQAMPEGTRLGGVSDSIRPLTANQDTARKSKKDKKEKKQKNEALIPKAPLEESSLQEIFSEPQGQGEEKPPSGPSKMAAMDYLRYAVLFVCFTVFLYSSYTLVDSLVSRAQSRSEYDQLSDSFHAVSPFVKHRLPQELPNSASIDLLSAYVGVQPEEYTPSLRDENAQTKIDKVTFLKNNKNKDTVGWILIEGTNIDYPVVHTKDNDYYLRRSYYGKTNLSGTLFFDSRNSKKLMENRNTVIYGHNMNDGSMFHNLHDLKNEDFFKTCTVEIATPNGIFLYEVFSVHEALETSEYFQCTFRDDEHFASWLEEMKGESIYQKEGMELSPGDKILTLSTCMDPLIQSEYRWAVHAKLVEVINYTP